MVGENRVDGEAGNGERIPGSCRILVVEDHDLNREIASALLAVHGIAHDAAVNGAEAVEKIRRGESYDLILMDVQMPVMNGIEATRAIRAYEREAGLARTPIVTMTATAVEMNRLKALAAGMDGYLDKPFTLDELLDVIRRLRRRDVPGGRPGEAS